MVRVDICPRQCLHIFHTVSKSMFHEYVVQLMSTSISWCLPCVQSSLRLPEPCVGDNESTTDGLSMKNSSDTIGNRTRDLPACSALPQPTALPAACPVLVQWKKIKGTSSGSYRKNFCWYNRGPSSGETPKTVQIDCVHTCSVY